MAFVALVIREMEGGWPKVVVRTMVDGLSLSAVREVQEGEKENGERKVRGKRR